MDTWFVTDLNNLIFILFSQTIWKLHFSYTISNSNIIFCIFNSKFLEMVCIHITFLYNRLIVQERLTALPRYQLYIPIRCVEVNGLITKWPIFRIRMNIQGNFIIGVSICKCYHFTLSHYYNQVIHTIYYDY